MMMDTDARLLCSEVLHSDFGYLRVLDRMLEKLIGEESMAVRISRYRFYDEIAKRIDRLGGMAGEW